MADEKPRPFKLIRKLDKVFIQFLEGGEEKPVKLLWPRPVSAQRREVSIVDEKKKEVVLLEDLSSLDADSRRIAEEELEKRYLTARIHRVLEATAQFGTRSWKVETDRGMRRFVVKSVNKDVTWITEDHILIRDTLGYRYEIPSLSALDEHSREEVDRVL
ncbi:MAG: DUF1854 domain-containing protein [Planctomycetota bacterium]|nr:DUF1854 domain-containing protein [Planctomycetota bacterium]